MAMMKDKYGVTKFYSTKTGGLEWYDKWDNGKSRTLLSNQWDPYDANLGFHYGGAGADVRKMVINGNGIATLPNNMSTSGSQRIFINGPWTNTETTVYLRWRTSIYKSFQLRSRSNHHGTKNLPYPTVYKEGPPTLDCGFGNYMVKWSEGGDNKARVQVEVIHDLYKRDLDLHSYNLPNKDKWTGFKLITRTINNTVKVEGYINYNALDQTNWIKNTEFTFTGSNVHLDPIEPNCTYCADKGDKISTQLDKNTLWLKPGKWTWIRINGGNDLDLKWFSVREINP
jgi:hypothetical protein